MSDSRRAAFSKIRMDRVIEFQAKIIYFLSSILLALFLTVQLGSSDFSETQNYVMFLLFFSIGLWVTEAIPPFAVGIMIIGFLVFFLGSDYFNAQPESVKKYVNTWSDSVMWLLLGGFFLAEGLKKVGLDSDLFVYTLTRFGSEPTRLLLGLMLATGIISMIMSNTATTAMMLATIAPLIKKLGKSSNYSKALLLGIASAAAIGGMGTIIGSPPNAIAVGSLENLGIKISFTGWMMYGVPMALIILLGFWYVLTRKYPPELKEVDLSFVMDREEETSKSESAQGETKLKKRIVIIVMSLTALLWLTNQWHGIPVAAVSGIPIILLTMVGIITSDDVRALPWDTLMLVAGGLSLGLAIKETGLAEYFISKLTNFNLNFYVLVVIFGFITVVFSNVMSNTATATILIPLASILEPANQIVLPIIIGLCASCALFLPVSTPPNAIAFSTGYIDQSDFRLGGIVVGIIGPIIITLFVLVVTAFV